MVIKILATCAVLLSACFSICGQTNIVPNAGFEQTDRIPNRWYYKGGDFTAAISAWSSATHASPDLYSEESRVPESWQTKGFGDQSAHGGANMVGVTLYGCTKGKPHCREYIQVPLMEPTVPGQDYLLALWAAPLKPGLRVNNLGALFSKEKISGNTDRILDFEPQLLEENIIADGTNGWQKIVFNWTADDRYRYLVIGNFFEDKETKTGHGPNHRHAFAYYYIDDVIFGKKKPFLPVHDPLSEWYPLQEGRIIEIKVLFDVDRSFLRQRAQNDLDRLVLLMQEYPDMEIEISGHTDSTGNFNHNMSLSDRRAQSVVKYLSDRSIAGGRMLAEGHGPTKPVTSNQTRAGRQKNRRVEFKILKM